MLVEKFSHNFRIIYCFRSQLLENYLFQTFYIYIFYIKYINIYTLCKILFFSVTTIPDPEFVDEIGNITVPAGRNVKLACSVKDLGSFKVCT